MIYGEESIGLKNKQCEKNKRVARETRYEGYSNVGMVIDTTRPTKKDIIDKCEIIVGLSQTQYKINT